MYAAKSSLFQKINEYIMQNHYVYSKHQEFSRFALISALLAYDMLFGSQVEAILLYHNLTALPNMLSDRVRSLPDAPDIVPITLDPRIWLLHASQNHHINHFQVARSRISAIYDE